MKKQLFITMALCLILTGCSSNKTTATLEATSSTPTIAEDTVSTEWKETMDSYEAFYDEYVEFMKSYDPNNLNSELISKYSELLQKYNEMSSAYEKIDEDSLSYADKAYFIEVNSKIQKKLLELTD